MVVKADHERIKTLLKDTITLLCRNGLNFKTEFSVEALIGITLDKEDVVLVSINEIIRTELGTQLALAKDAEERNATMRSSDQDGSSESQPGTPLSTNGHQYRKRKHSSGHGSQREPLDDEQESDSADEDGRSFEKASAASPLVDESNSEPSNKRSLDDSNAPATRIKDDDTKDVIYIKEEIDTGDWPDGSHTQDSFTDPNIPAAGTSDQQHDDNFDFLHGGSLVPISSDSTMPQSWSDVAQSAPPGMNISPSKRSSTAVGTPTQGDQSQQKFGQAIYSLASRQGCVQVKHGEGGSPIQYTCTICYRTVRTRRGFEAHMGQHLGVYRYSCTVCKKGFPSTTALKDHQRSHTGQKLLCPTCGKQFVSYSGLSQHLKVTHQWSSLQVRNQMHGDVGGRAGSFAAQPQFQPVQPEEPAAGRRYSEEDVSAAVTSQPSLPAKDVNYRGRNDFGQTGDEGTGHRQIGRFPDQTGGDEVIGHQQAGRYGDGGEEMSRHQQTAAAALYRHQATGDAMSRHQPQHGERLHPPPSPGGYLASHHRTERYLSTDSRDHNVHGRQQTDGYQADDDPDSVLKESFPFDPDTSL